MHAFLSNVHITVPHCRGCALNLLCAFVAAIREVYKVKPADYKPLPIDSVRSKMAGAQCLHEGKENLQPGLFNGEAAPQETLGTGRSTFLQLADDEFYDVPEDSLWECDIEPELDADAQRKHTELEGTSDEDQVAQFFNRMPREGTESPDVHSKCAILNCCESLYFLSR